EVDVTEMGKINVRRVTSIVDAGRTVNPDTIAAQVQGGLLFGMTAALYGDITLKDGRVQQRNFNDYRMMRINEAPQIDVHVVPSTEDPGGIGEPGCSAGPPSLVNAVFAATGVRIHRLPIDRTLLASRKIA
ncbi:MAG: xanthine dehydrogenase family protein molybdopterin-binding subunit, partial [Proteobacteria bacterium]|nr:xanthine dehydrogenase family protein molybdopterin-binding subunit [Pseudomonadota bacterium]